MGLFIMKKYIHFITYVLIGVVACSILWLLISSIAQKIMWPESEQLRTARETSKIASLEFHALVDRWVYIGFFSILFFSILTITYGFTRSRLNISLVHHAIIAGSDIPIHYKDLTKMTPILTGLMNAEGLRAVSAGREDGRKETIEAFKNVANLQSKYYQTAKIALPQGQDVEQKALPFTTPSFADLLKDELAPGKPLILGYKEGRPEYRTLKNLKSMAVAGWQGSGKTLSTAYIIASSVLCYDAKVFVIDPHKGHDEGLYRTIQPLEQHGLIQVVNPFYMPQLIKTLTTTLDNRLSGTESSLQPILLVIDELARLAESKSFDELIKFIERATEETRKANITFIGCSQKWTARHFKGRADIRGCMNSALIHKTKSSQADLLLEDSQDKKLVKQLEHPGDAILMTDYAGPDIVSMPLATRYDMDTVVKMIGNGEPIECDSSVTFPASVTHTHNTSHTLVTGDTRLAPPLSDSELLRIMRQKKASGVTISSMATDMEFGRTYLSKWINGSEEMTETLRAKLHAYCQKKRKILPFKLEKE